jgi:hypothetical protein
MTDTDLDDVLDDDACPWCGDPDCEGDCDPEGGGEA